MDLWIELLNSDWHDHIGTGRREDRLDDPVWFAGYVSRLGGLPVGADEGELREMLRELRNVLRAIVDQIAARRPVSGSLWDDLNGFLAMSPSVRQLDYVDGSYSLRSRALVNDAASVVAGVAEEFCRVLAEADSSRIKICENKDCLWVFYDRSKNRSRRWCEGDTGCGTLMKVRRFREKHRGKQRRQA